MTLSPSPSPKIGEENLSDGLVSLLPAWEKGLRDEGA